MAKLKSGDLELMSPPLHSASATFRRTKVTVKRLRTSDKTDPKGKEVILVPRPRLVIHLSLL